MSTFKNINVENDINIGGLIYGSQFYVKPGDVFNSKIDTSGIITSGKKVIGFLLPFFKYLDSSVTGYTLSFSGCIRQNDKYIFGDSSENTTFTGTNHLIFNQGGSIRIRMQFDTALSTAINNDAVAITGTVSVKFT